MLFAEPLDFGGGIFDDVTEPAVVRVNHPPVVSERFAPGVDDNLIRDGVADDRADELCGAVLDGHQARSGAVPVVVDVRAGADFR